MMQINNKKNVKTKFCSFVFAIMVLILGSCNTSEQQKEKTTTNDKQVAQQAKINFPAVEKDFKTISTAEAVRLAEKQFENYAPKILADQEAVLDVTESYTGDFTGDGIDDVAIYFSLASYGGNAIIGQGLALYQNKGRSVEVIAGFEPDYLFSIDKIANGKISITKIAYADTDGRCCPSIKTAHTLTISGNKVF